MHADTLLAVPRVSPEWELSALRVLMKPKEHEKGAIRHRPAHQPWPSDAAERVESACRVARERLGYDPRPHLPPEGDYFLVLSIRRDELLRATAFAVVLSQALPEQWLVFGRLYLEGGKFYRRERGFKLNLVPATNVHLPREMRTAIGKAPFPASMMPPCNPSPCEPSGSPPPPGRRWSTSLR